MGVFTYPIFPLFSFPNLYTNIVYLSPGPSPERKGGRGDRFKTYFPNRFWRWFSSEQ